MTQPILQPGIETVDLVGTVEMLLEKAGFSKGHGFPLTRQEVFRVLSALDYLPPPDLLDYLQSTDQFHVPEFDQWEPQHVVALIGACEGLRLWRIHPSSLHWSKLSRWAQSRYHAQREGRFGPAAELFSRYSLRQLGLEILHAGLSGDKDAAEQAFCFLEAKIESLGKGKLL